MDKIELREPHEYERRILIATVGLEPKTLTETLYAIAVQSEKVFVPNEIHIITTQDGQKIIKETLLLEKKNILKKLGDDYGLPDFTEAVKAGAINVIKDEFNNPLNDITNQKDNVAAADTIISIVQKLSEDTNAALHVSLSGGRKTMGFLLGYALSLYGRRQDRLSHVCVRSELESHPEFYYPPLEPSLFKFENGKEISTDDANLVLVDIPFVRMRSGLPSRLFYEGHRFSDSVNAFQSDLSRPKVLIDIFNHTLSLHGIRIVLQPLRFAFYVWLVKRKKNNEGVMEDGSVHWSEIESRDIKQLLSIYRRSHSVTEEKYQYQVQKLSSGIERDVFEENKARINATFKKELGYLSQFYEIQKKSYIKHTHKGRRLQRIGLDLTPNEICFCSLSHSDQKEE